MGAAKIYHNSVRDVTQPPRADRHAGVEPVVIEYLKTPPTKDKLRELVSAMGIPVRGLLREKGTPYAELHLADPKLSDDELLEAMLEHPILINRPIFGTARGTKLCRPTARDLHRPRRDGPGTACR